MSGHSQTSATTRRGVVGGCAEGVAGASGRGEGGPRARCGSHGPHPPRLPHPLPPQVHPPCTPSPPDPRRLNPLSRLQFLDCFFPRFFPSSFPCPFFLFECSASERKDSIQIKEDACWGGILFGFAALVSSDFAIAVDADRGKCDARPQVQQKVAAQAAAHASKKTINTLKSQVAVTQSVSHTSHSVLSLRDFDFCPRPSTLDPRPSTLDPRP
eukprot:485535-Rhodomonas_salina.1